MAGKRYRAQLRWYNTMAWATVGLFLLLVGLLVAAALGAFRSLAVLAAIVLIGAVVSWLRDRGTRCLYIIEGDELLLRSSSREKRIPLGDVQDASLVDRAAARDYIQQKLRKAMDEGVSRQETKARQKAFVRFCSVDIGLRSFSLGLGRRMIDRMPRSRYDLVLLRLRGGEDYLLSPIYNQDLVAGINRSSHAQRRA